MFTEAEIITSIHTNERAQKNTKHLWRFHKILFDDLNGAGFLINAPMSVYIMSV